MIKVVFLDIGGVILDEEALYDKLFDVQKDVLRQCGIPLSDDEYACALRDTLLSFAPGLQRALVWRLTRPDRELCDKATRTARAIFEDWLDDQARRLVKGIAEVIETIAQSFSLALTSCPDERARNLLERQDLLHYFDVTGLESDVRFPRQDPRLYERLAQECHIHSREAILISNRFGSDLLPARAAGMRTILFKNGIYAIQEPRTPEEFPHKTVTSAAELPEAVNAIAARYQNR